MTRREKRIMLPWLDGPGGSASTSASHPASLHPYARKKHLGENVVRLLAWREVAPSVKTAHRQLWGGTAAWSVAWTGLQRETTNAKQALISWFEAESLQHCSAKYCPLHPAPRSTIAAAFSPDGNTLASTHGDHTVKIICCRTGYCLKVLVGHRRTPWVVRFHPSRSKVLASGSLDNEVRLWDANTAECTGSRDFYRPIASLAFHAQGDLLAVASGHKLYIWQYTKEGESASPSIVLRTRRSLRAVHFHPHAAPFLLTAEVNDLDSPDCPMTIATSQGYRHGPTPTIHSALSGSAAPQSNPTLVTPQFFVPFPNWFWPAVSNAGDDLGVSHPDPTAPMDTDVAEDRGSTIQVSRSQQLQQELECPESLSPAPMDISPAPSYVDATLSMTTSGVTTSGRGPIVGDTGWVSDTRNVEDSESTVILQEGHAFGGDQGSSPTVVGAPWGAVDPVPQQLSAPNTTRSHSLSSSDSIPSRVPVIPVARRQGESGVAGPGPGVWPIHAFPNLHSEALTEGGIADLQQFLPGGDYTGLDLPFLHGWVQGQQAQGGIGPSALLATEQPPAALDPLSNDVRESQQPLQQQQNAAVAVASVAVAAAMAAARVAARGAGGVGATSAGLAPVIGVGPGMRLNATEGIPIPGRGGLTALNIGTAEAAAAAAAAELPCTVKLRIWPHDIKRPSALLDQQTCRLTIPHAVLCSEMGAHFSPCGRFLAACVACVVPPLDPETSGNGSRASVNGSPNAGTSVQSPTQHPISAQQVIYELRVYSLEEATFGQVLASRAVRAAHCLTSIQFSPTSGHVLLAYGRRHNSLLRSLVVDGTTTIPIYTILEVYRVSDMELVKVLPSAEDEVNVACFHPCVGGGLVYGTKEGKLRILRHDRTPRHLHAHQGLEDDLLQAETSDPLSFGMVPDIDEPF